MSHLISARVRLRFTLNIVTWRHVMSLVALRASCASSSVVTPILSHYTLLLTHVA